MPFILTNRGQKSLRTKESLYSFMLSCDSMLEQFLTKSELVRIKEHKNTSKKFKVKGLEGQRASACVSTESTTSLMERVNPFLSFRL